MRAMAETTFTKPVEGDVAKMAKLEALKAIAKSMVQLKYRGEIFHGRGVARDITRASYDAIINAFDALYRLKL